MDNTFKATEDGKFKIDKTKAERNMFELEFLSELNNYLTEMQMSYYSKKDNAGNDYDALDIIDGVTNVKSFLIGNVIKYISRYGKKKGNNREDLLKAIHYIIYLAFYVEKKN